LNYAVKGKTSGKMLLNMKTMCPLYGRRLFITIKALYQTINTTVRILYIGFYSALLHVSASYISRNM